MFVNKFSQEINTDLPPASVFIRMWARNYFAWPYRLATIMSSALVASLVILVPLHDNLLLSAQFPSQKVCRERQQ